MDIKINKILEISLAILLLVSFVSGPIYSILYDYFYQDPSLTVPLITHLIKSFSSINPYLDNIFIGICLFLYVNKLRQDNWIWLLIGLAYGEYSLVLLLMILIFQGTKSHEYLYNSISKVLLLLIIATLWNLFYKAVMFTPSFIYDHLDGYLSHSVIMFWFSYYRQYLIYVILFMMNILFAINISVLLKKLTVSKKVIWIIFIILFGLFPVIVLNQFAIVKKDNNQLKN